MMRGVSYLRFDPKENIDQRRLKLNKLIESYCDKVEIEIVRSWEDVNDADAVFGADGWCELEEYVYNHQDEIDAIVVPTADTLFESNIHAIIEKTEFMETMDIQILIASTE